MKDQRNSLQNRSVFFTVTAILLMLVISVMGFTAIVSAAEQTEIEVTEENFTLVEGTGMKYENGVYVKGYDGTSDAFLKASDYTDNLPEGVEIIDVTATFVKADGKTAAVNAGEATHVKVNFTFNDGGFNAAGILLPATIVPCEKTSDTIEVTYSPEGIVIDSVNSYALANSLELGVLNAGTHEITTNVLSSNGNYRFTKLSVKVNPVVITSIEWGKTSWVYGEAAVAPEAFDADNNPYGALKVTGKNTTIDGKGVWEKGDVGKYTLTATPINGNYVLADGVANTCNVEITVKKFTVSISDTIKAGDGLNLFFPTVEGIDNPNILGLVEFLNADGSKFEGIKFGTATVTVKLPKSENFVFVDGMGSSELPQTVTVKIGHSQKMFPVYDKSGAQVGNIILVATNEGGFFDDVTVDATAIKGYPKIVKSKYSQVYEIKVNGAAEGETFTVIIPLNDSVYAPRTEGLEAAFYVYNTLSGKLVSASDAGLTATLKDGYYQVGGFSGEATFAIAPDYNAPFFQTVWGILLIIVIILAILTLMCYIGLYLRRIRETEEATTVVIDTVGELPATEAIAEETVEVDADAVIEENLEEAAETVEETAEEVVVDEAELQSAVEESVQDLMDEVAEIELPAEEVTETAAEEAPVEEAAEEVVEEAAEEVIEEAAEVVEEAAEETPVEEAPVEEVAVAAEVVAEEAPADEEADDNDEDDNNDDDANGDDAVEAVSMVEEEDTSFGFGAGADPSTFVDVKENPEAYQEMLDREARGEIQVVYRYKKSFQSKLAQSQGNVQDYYSELKNALLTFKGVKNRLSWNYEAFNKGRVHVAKMDAKSKTLYLYLALDPTQFNDTKYGVVDVSAKRRYASTPTLIKIKGERKFKHALELIEKLCGEQMELVKTEAENVDYRIERMTIDELVDAGLMKKIAGYVILAPQDDAVPADASVETAPEQN